MDTNNVRETKRADELKEGDWTAPNGITALPAEVLHAVTYEHPGGGGTRTHLVLREFGIALPFSETYPAALTIGVASAQELATIQAGAERAKRIADIRALADFLEARPELPVGFARMQTSVNLHGDVWESGVEGVAEVRRLAAAVGAEVCDTNDDRTEFSVLFGDVEYKHLSWHRSGRPTEPLRTGGVVDGGELVDETTGGDQ